MSYEKDEIERVEKDHDWTYRMGIKFFGSKNSSKTMRMSQEQFEEIKRILS